MESRDGFDSIEVTDLRRASSDEEGSFWGGNGDGGRGAAEVAQVRGRAIEEKNRVGFGRRALLTPIDWNKQEAGIFRV